MSDQTTRPSGRLRRAAHTLAAVGRRILRAGLLTVFFVAVFTFVAAGIGTLGLAVERPGPSATVNDVTQLNPIRVSRVFAPQSTEEIVEAVRAHPGPISIGGGRYSMGGQTATEGALQLDMRQFDRILAFSPRDRTITVQAGTRWRQIQEHIDSAGLAVKIMQTYANFTVGGSLSVNVHGR